MLSLALLKKLLYVTSFKRYTKWELIHSNIPSITIKNGEDEISIIKQYYRFDKYHKRYESKVVPIYRDSFSETVSQILK
jgi:hypothetical protein